MSKAPLSKESTDVVAQATAVLQNVLGLLGEVGRLDSVFESLEKNGPQPAGKETVEGLAETLLVIFAMAHTRRMDLPTAMIKVLDKALKSTRENAKSQIGNSEKLSDMQLNFLMSLPCAIAEKNQMAQYMIDKADVYIERQTEVPDAPPYAICVLEQPDFWVDCDNTSMAAHITARALGFTIVPKPTHLRTA